MVSISSAPTLWILSFRHHRSLPFSGIHLPSAYQFLTLNLSSYNQSDPWLLTALQYDIPTNSSINLSLKAWCSGNGCQFRPLNAIPNSFQIKWRGSHCCLMLWIESSYFNSLDMPACPLNCGGFGSCVDGRCVCVQGRAGRACRTCTVTCDIYMYILMAAYLSDDWLFVSLLIIFQW
jgi:hypothetical protein